ncbi:MAG TPA: OB-fold domain-containing protein [Acidimicrobiales bacterium]|nr:OB-fold domain-containing protein [Acidimicrobiales bacterium]
MVDKPFRVLPRVTGENEHFWRGGAAGELRFLRCRDCGQYVHPPAPICPRCLSKDLGPEAVSGRARVATFTVNHQAWYPGLDPPYVIAIVEIEEQPDVRLMTNILNCEVDRVEIGMPVTVTFEQHDDVWIPLFEPSP